jgi:drug/metabolite transporter (DMT)-like permease
MDRRWLEKTTASLAVILLFFLTFATILAVANLIFEWDIFPPGVEKFLYFILASCVAIIISSVLVNVMINLSMLASNSERLLHDKKEEL